MSVVPSESPEGEEAQALVEHSGELLRLAGMSRELLDEVRRTDLDEAGRARLQSVYGRVLESLKESVPAELRQELDSVAISFERIASESELRLAHAQLVGWLEGLFRGVQAAMMAGQLERQLGQAGRLPRAAGDRPAPGQYL